MSPLYSVFRALRTSTPLRCVRRVLEASPGLLRANPREATNAFMAAVAIVGSPPSPDRWTAPEETREWLMASWPILELFFEHGAPLDLAPGSSPAGTPLAIAVVLPHPCIAEALLARGADPNAPQRVGTILSMARDLVLSGLPADHELRPQIEARVKEMVALLLRHGARE